MQKKKKKYIFLLDYFKSHRNIGINSFGNFIFLSFVKKYLQLYFIAVAQCIASGNFHQISALILAASNNISFETETTSNKLLFLIEDK